MIILKHPSSYALEIVLTQILEERRNQDKKWGGPAFDDERERTEWLSLIREHEERAKRAVSRTGDLDEYRQQMIQIAALAIAAIHAHDRRAGADVPA